MKNDILKTFSFVSLVWNLLSDGNAHWYVVTSLLTNDSQNQGGAHRAIPDTRLIIWGVGGPFPNLAAQLLRVLFGWFSGELLEIHLPLR